MTFEELEEGKWYTCGEACELCVKKTENWVLFLHVSTVHHCVDAEIVSKEDYNDYASDCEEAIYDYENELQRSVVTGYSHASYRDEEIEKYNNLKNNGNK